MFKKLKSEINRIKWPNKNTVVNDLKIVLIGSTALILVISIIDWISRLSLNLFF